MSRHRIVIARPGRRLSGIGGALACGPIFPWQLLDDREATLFEPPAGLGFMSPAQDPRAVAAGHAESGRPHRRCRRRASSSPSRSRRTKPSRTSGARWSSGRCRRTTIWPSCSKARRATTADETLAAGDGLPAAVLRVHRRRHRLRRREVRRRAGPLPGDRPRCRRRSGGCARWRRPSCRAAPTASSAISRRRARPSMPPATGRWRARPIRSASAWRASARRPALDLIASGLVDWPAGHRRR